MSMFWRSREPPECLTGFGAVLNGTNSLDEHCSGFLKPNSLGTRRLGEVRNSVEFVFAGGA
jgi:hypothetical protein